MRLLVLSPLLNRLVFYHPLTHLWRHPFILWSLVHGLKAASDTAAWLRDWQPVGQWEKPEPFDVMFKAFPAPSLADACSSRSLAVSDLSLRSFRPGVFSSLVLCPKNRELLLIHLCALASSTKSGTKYFSEKQRVLIEAVVMELGHQV